MTRVSFWVVLLAARLASAQAAETETARILPVGVVEAGAGVEYQLSSEGSESALPMIVEGGLAERLELVVEQVALTAIRPKVGKHATGVGDLEVTLVGLAVHERARTPAVAFGAEVKVPTARNELIGTRELDYTGYLILSKRLGPVDLHVNASYAVIGKPSGVTSVDNVFGFGALARYFVGHGDIYAEVLGSTAAIPEVEGMDSASELTGGELVGTLGVAYWIRPSLQLFVSASIDNNAAVLIHPGLTFTHALF